jgi:heat shock protein HspQ
MADHEYFNIMDVDPNFSPIEEGVYKLRINKMTLKEFPKKDNSGESWRVVNGDFTVVDDATFSGRRLFPTFWLTNSFDLKSLRKIADRTGVTQEPTENFEAWLGKLTSIQPEFRSKIEVVDEIDRATKQPKVDEITGKPMKTNVINFKTVLAA